MDIFHGLNEAQREAVECLEGPLLIMAGAGSGKTRVLTHRIANLLDHGVAPYSILAITFTNKAAKEMRDRVDRLIGAGAKEIQLSTFHAFCAKFLRREIEHGGEYNNNFTIYDASDAQTVVKRILKEMNLDDKRFTPNGILGAISNAKNQLIGPMTFEKNAAGFFEQKVAEVYKNYQRFLRENNAVDFDDLLMLTVRLLEEHQEILEKYQRRYRYILVDEYQDTNGAQYTITKLLADGWRNLCVVGDADQSIYGWRGADISNILNFEKDYPEARTIMLEQNYRSTKNILAAANAVIDENQNRKPKKLWTDNAQGDKITTYYAADERDEAKYIVDAIAKQHTIYNTSYNDVAILYRTNAQSRVLEETFMRMGLPYTMVGGLKFYDRKEIKDISAYLRILHNPYDQVSMTRIINVPKRGIGDATVQKILDYALENNKKFLDVIGNPEELDNVPGLTSRSKNPINKFLTLFFTLMEKKETLAVSDLIEEIMDKSGYVEELKADKKIENESRIENLREFVGVAREFEKETEEEPNLENFLSRVSLTTDLDESDLDADRVTLMTLHAAKGLEFPVVFMAGMEEGIFPHARTLESPDELEEERRTCYVGITRAERKLYLTYARSRMLYGRSSYNAPSRFLEEIPEELKDEFEARGGFGGNSFNSFGSSEGLDGYNGYNSSRRDYSGRFNNGNFTRMGNGQSLGQSRINYSNGNPNRHRQGQPMSGMSALQAMGSNGNGGKPSASSVAASIPGVTLGVKPAIGAIKPDMSIKWKAGDKAKHGKWGIGTVVAVSGAGEEVQLRIAFDGLGVKSLMQKYAPIEKV